MKVQDISGKKFERLLVVSFVERVNKQSIFLCKCDCGNYIKTSSNALKTGHNKSCGCLNIELIKKRSTTHGLSKHPLFSTWCDMKNRCYYKKHNRYNNYGGKGIIVCDEWHTFINFYNWAIQFWKENLSIDRIDNLKNYEPNNCRFATIKEQNRNRTSCVKITHNGKTMSIVEWSEYLNIPYETLRARIKRGKAFLN
jgi:hypothetical protein